MALYDVECLDCGNQEEILARIEQLDGEGNVTSATCSKCGSEHIKKLISRSTGFQLKGKGWFKDGY